MKKQHLKLTLIGGMLLSISATVNAQWTENATTVYLNSTTKNVGIGTTTPAFAIDLIRSGSANLSLKSTTGTSNLLLDRANSAATSSVSYRTNGVGTWQTGTVGNDNFNIRNIGLGNTAMSISATNNNVGLGVGTPLIVLDTKAGQTIGTTATTGTYHAAGNQGEKVSFGYVPSNASGEFVGMKVVVNPGTNFCGNSGDIYFNTWECNTSTSRPVMTINGTGNVGIGTTTPQAKLHIKGGNLVLDNTNQRFLENGTPTWDISGGSSSYAIGRSGIDYPFVIELATANVGIGTTTPSAKLDIVGDAKINGHPIGRGKGNIQSNVCFGKGSLDSNSTGSENVANGIDALKKNKTGSFNVAIGTNALSNNTTGNNNTAVGVDAGVSAGGFINTTAIGASAFVQANGGTAIGAGAVAGDAFYPSNNSTAIGAGAVAEGINSTAIGAGAVAGYDNSIVLGNNAVVSIGTTPSNSYQLSVATASSSNRVAIRGVSLNTNYGSTGVEGICSVNSYSSGIYGESSTGYAGRFSGDLYCSGTYNPSDMRLKENIKPVDNAMSLISKLDVKTYNYKEEFASMNLPKGTQYGFIAQQVEEVLPNLIKVTYDNSKDKDHPFEFKAINYVGLIPLLVQTTKEQNTINEKLFAENADLKAQIISMNDCIQSLCNNAATSKVETSIDSHFGGQGALFQNSPNPFNQTTIIRYALNNESNNGRIIIRDLNGNMVKQINIANTSRGQVTINANELTQGTYTYTLEIAGASVDTKLMVVTK